MGGNETFDIKVDKEACTKCGACVDVCPAHIFYLETGEIKSRYQEHCILCGHCICVCPEDAVIHPGFNAADFVDVKKGMEIDNESLYHFLRTRRSCRAFKDKTVPRDVLEELVDIGRLAPTAHNWQNVEFLVISDKEKVKSLSKITSEFFGTLAKNLEANREHLPEYMQGLIHGANLNYEFSKAGKDRVFRGAPVVIIVHGETTNPSTSENCHYAQFQIAMMAHSMGLGATIIGYLVGAAPHSPEVIKELAIPEGNQVYGCVALGYPKRKFLKMPTRKSAVVEWR